MNKNMKLLITSLIILACSVGFFIGATVFHDSFPMKYNDSRFIEKMDSKDHRFRGPSDKIDKKDKKLHSSLNSILQLTPEQKIKLDSHRVLSDSLRELSIQKIKQAEINLQEALNVQPIDEKMLEQVKNVFLQLNEERLDQRIKEIRFFSEILSAEQYRAFIDFHKKKRFNPKRDRDYFPKDP